MGKFYVFGAIVERGPEYYWYAMVGAVNAAIAAFYYARVLKTMILDEGNEDKPAFTLPALDRVWVTALVVANTLPLLWWARIDDWVRGSLTLYAGLR